MKKPEYDIYTSDGRINPDKAFALVQTKMNELTPEQFVEMNSKPFEMKGVDRAVVRVMPGNSAANVTKAGAAKKKPRRKGKA